MSVRPYALALMLALPGPAGAAAKDPAPKKADAAAKGAPKADPADADLASAGKVIEIDAAGNARVVKGGEAVAVEVGGAAEPGKALKPSDISAAEACRQRVMAQCAAIKRCLPSDGELPLPCDLMAQACDELPGKAPYARKALEACAQGIAALKCSSSVEQTAQALMRPESAVPACKAVVEAEVAAGASGVPVGPPFSGEMDEKEAPARGPDPGNLDTSGGSAVP